MISEDVPELLRLAQVVQPIVATERAIGGVTEDTEAACRAAGQGSPDAGELFDAGMAAVEQLQTGLTAVKAFYDLCGVVAARHT